MGTDYVTGELAAGTSVADYFRDSLGSALTHQKVEAAEETIFYVVNLLSYYGGEGDFFVQAEKGVFQQPLAVLYMRAVDASTLKEQQNALRRLGDVALVTSALCTIDGFNRKSVNIDYYIAMGGGAYGFLSDASIGEHGRLYSIVFGELSTKFRNFVDVLAEVIEPAHLDEQADVLRLYDIWMRTGSEKAAARLRQLGIEPCGASLGRRQN